MKTKKIISVLLGITLIATLVGGCGAKKEQTKEASKLKEVNITYVKSPLNVPSILEKNKGSFEEMFKEDKTEVKFHEITAGPDQTQGLASGDLDFLHALGNTSAILAASQGVDLKIINVYSRGPKAFMLITKNDEIKSPKDLKGKKVGGPKGTVLHQLLVAALEKENLTQKDVNFVSMGIPEATAALNNGSIDVALLAGPAALKSKAAGARVIVTGEGYVDGTIVTAVSGDFYKNHKDVVDKFRKVQENTLKYMKENEEDALTIAAKEVGLTLEQAKEMYSWYDFNMNITDEDIKGLEKTQEFLIKNGLQQKSINIKDIIAK